MIIQLESATAADAETARCSLQDLAGSWARNSPRPRPRPAPPRPPAPERATAAIDRYRWPPWVVSLPSAALDLTDRIRKQRRAEELIDHARHQATRQVGI